MVRENGAFSNQPCDFSYVRRPGYQVGGILVVQHDFENPTYLSTAVQIVVRIEKLAVANYIEWIGCEWYENLLWIYVPANYVVAWHGLRFNKTPGRGQFTLPIGPLTSSGVGKFVSNAVAERQNEWLYYEIDFFLQHN